MSLAPEIDEIAHTLKSNKTDIALFSGTRPLTLPVINYLGETARLETMVAYVFFVSHSIFWQPFSNWQSEGREVLWVLQQSCTTPLMQIRHPA